MARRDFLARITVRLSAHEIPAPAKINLFLAVTGRRTDGYHDLVSVAAPLLWGDALEVEPRGSGFTVESDDKEMPTDGSNLVLRAASAFALETGWTGGARFIVKKRIPMGAGLGGASTDATSAIVALNEAAGAPLDPAGLLKVAGSVGSDCALFLSRAPVIMRGRGERVEALPKEAYRRIRGMRVLLFKPGFGVPTPWAYSRMAADAPRGYVTPGRAEAMLSSWIAKPGAPVEDLLFNSMEKPVFSKFAALPVLLETLRSRFGLSGRMSGSGSACFLLLHEAMEAAPIESSIREAWGKTAFVVETRIA
jgi:4-diphosphocytidyl-2-C-methyl-D-erythritol kinase